MSDTITTTNMSLTVPVVQVDPGPDYALNVNACFAILDGHTHAPGSGVQITPNGLNINADLPFGSNNAIALRSTRFTAQNSPLAGAADLGCLYESGVDLYYNDGNGNQIRITQSGSVAGSSGTITGLPSGTASAAYNSLSATFIFQSATSVAANMDVRSIILRNAASSSDGLTLSAPTLSSNYSLVLPALPSANNTFLQMDTSGNITAINSADGIGQLMTSVGSDAISAVRTRPVSSSVSAGGIAQSSSSGAQTITSTSPVGIGNNVSITTSGRPVMILFNGDGTGGSNVSSVFITGGNTQTSVDGTFTLYKGGSPSGYTQNMRVHGTPQGSPNSTLTLEVPAGTVCWIDTQVAGTPGTYSYQVYGQVSSGGTLGINYATLVAYEL